MQDILFFLHQHTALSAILIIVLVLLITLEYIKLKQNAKSISPALATQMINHQNAVVLDIRNVEAFSTGHIVNAVSIPLAELENKLKKLEPCKSQPIVIICATGQESPRAAALLTQQGFNTFILANGINGWKAAEMPLIKD